MQQDASGEIKRIIKQIVRLLAAALPQIFARRNSKGLFEAAVKGTHALKPRIHGGACHGSGLLREQKRSTAAAQRIDIFRNTAAEIGVEQVRKSALAVAESGGKLFQRHIGAVILIEILQDIAGEKGVRPLLAVRQPQPIRQNTEDCIKVPLGQQLRGRVAVHRAKLRQLFHTMQQLAFRIGIGPDKIAERSARNQLAEGGNIIKRHGENNRP